jgi:hypothetical protein
VGPGEKLRECPTAWDRPFSTRPGFFDRPTVDRIDQRFDCGEVRTYAIGLVNGIERVIDEALLARKR